MTDTRMALHEVLEIHELLAFKNVCLTKASVMPVLVSDERLKALMAQTATIDRRHISDLQALLSNVETKVQSQGLVH